MIARSLALVLLMLVMATSAPAQTAYPSGQSKLVVGFAPGGGNDILARYLAEKLGAHYKSTFIVENRPGANGIIAIEAVKRSEPNGQTLLVGPSSGMTFNPILLKQIPYDPVKDFAPIAMVGQFPLIIVVKASSPITSLQELVAQAKAKPGALAYSSAASSFQMATEAFNQRADIKLLNVPYRGSAPAATAVLSGDVTVNFGDVSAVLPAIQGGQLRALAVTTQQRIPSLPDVPTVAESYPGFEMVFWSGVFAPVQTPEVIRSDLEHQIELFVGAPEFRERLGKLGVESAYMPGVALGEKIKADISAYRQIAEKAGIQAE